MSIGFSLGNFGGRGSVEFHRCCVSEAENGGPAFAFARADGIEDMGGAVALILRRRGSGAAPRPSNALRSTG